MENLRDALVLLSAKSPGVVLLDMRLDSVDPETSVLAIRRTDPSVILILYSGSEAAIRETETSGIARAAYATLRKPFAPTDLLNILAEAFDA